MDRHEQGECAEPSNPSLPLEVHVRRMLAQDRNTQVRVLQQLAGDEDRAVRAYTARNRSLPVEVLVELARDQDPEVRRETATNRSLPVEVLVELARDQDPEVRDEVASNEHIPVPTLEELLRDPSASVRDAATQSLIDHLDMHELSPAEREVADRLASDGWQGTLADLLAAARSLGS